MRVVAAFVLLVIATPLAAQIEAGLHHVLVVPAGESDDPAAELDVGSGRGFGVSLEWFVNERYSLHASGTWANPATFLRANGEAIDLATLGIDVYAITSRRYFAPSRRFSPSLGLGASYVVLGNLEDRFGEAIEMDFEDVFTATVEAGLRYRITPRLAVTTGASWSPVEAKASSVLVTDPEAQLPSQLSLDPLIVRIGAVWRF